MALDRLAELEAQAERARQKLDWLREGLEPEMLNDAMGVRRWRPSREVRDGIDRHKAKPRDRVAFHVPTPRPHRLATASGATSFHFKHSFINKVTTERMEDGRRNRPGAAKAHNAYVERDTAVAVLTAAITLKVAETDIVSPAPERATEAQHHDAAAATSSAAPGIVTTEEKENERRPDDKRGRPRGAAFDRSLLQRYLAVSGDQLPGNDAGTEAGLRLLSGVELVRRGRQSGLLLQGHAQIPVDAGTLAAAVRHETAGAQGAAGEPERLTGQAPSGHDRYIVRGSAVAVQPDGHRALFTNIDPDPVKRAEFWELVEEHERAGGPDQMSCRFADRPDFWARVVQHADCPEALRDEYRRVDHARTARFDIEAGDAMRTFLARQDGWIPNRKRRPDESKAAFAGRDLPFADFHDGRRGRTQYRIVGELPDELSMEGRVRLLRDFSDEFRRRRIPFVAVMHAPDHNNDEKNWHFHLIYYDRPCARITAAQIIELDREGYDIAKLEVGMWDFAAVTNKRNRVNRSATPLQQKKVGEVGNDRWIGNLRRSFAARTNTQLEKERIERRVDPRRHADMGIPGDPQEHLGTRQAAAETRGIVTPIGRVNEERQSRTIEAIIEQKHAAERAAIARQVEQWQIRSAGRPASASSSFADALDEFSDSLTTAAALDRLASELRHGVARAGSRATHVRRTNDQLVRAIDANPAAGSARERRKRAELVEAASDYLEWLGITLSDERQLIAECDAEAGRLRTRAAIVEAQMAAAVSVAPAPVGMTPTVTPPLSGVDRDGSPPANADDALDRWITQIEAGRPYIRGGRSGYSVAGHAIILTAGSDAQRRLAVLHRRQQHEISRIANHLRARPTALAFDVVDGRRRFRVRGLDPDLAKAFLRYRDGPELIAVINATLNPDQGARRRLGAGGGQWQLPTAPPAALVQAPHPIATPQSSEVEIWTPPARAAAIVDDVPVSEPPGAPYLPAGREGDPPSVDTQRIVRELIAARIPLTIAQDHFIDRVALRAGKVDEGIIETIRRDPLLIVRAADQIETAIERIRTHLARHPGDLAVRPEGYVLEGDAPTELVVLAQFHSEAPRWRQQLDTLYRALHPVASAPASMAPITPVMPVTPDRRPAIERHPGRFSTVEPDLVLRAEARKYALEQTRKRNSSMEPSHASVSVQSVQHVPVSADTSKDRDIVHGEAARRAAQRAAVQRGS